MLEILMVSYKVILSVIVLIFFVETTTNAQGISYRVNNVAGTGEWYRNNDLKIVGRVVDTASFEFMSANIMFSGVDSNSASPSTGTLVWMNSLNSLKRTQISAMRFAQSNVTGLSDSLLSKVNNSQLATVAKTGSYLDLSNAPAAVTQTDSIKTRSFNTAYIISATRRKLVTYSVSIAATISLTTGQSGTVSLQTSPDNITYTEVSRFTNGNTGSLTIGLNLTNTQAGIISGVVPANFYVKLVSSGTGVVTYLTGQESTL